MRFLLLFLVGLTGCATSRPVVEPLPPTEPVPTSVAELDRPPAPPCEYVVCIDKVREEQGVRLLATNRDSVTQYVTFTLTLDNMEASGEAPYLTTVRPGETVEAMRITASDESQPWRWRYRYRWRAAVRTAELTIYRNRSSELPSGTPDLTVRYRGDSTRVVAEAINGLYMPIRLRAWSPDSAYAPLAERFTIEARDTVRIFDGRPPAGWMDAPEPEALFLKAAFDIAWSVARPDSLASYLLPTSSGDTLSVLFGSETSTTFKGGPIAAARSGILVQEIDGSHFRPDALRRLIVLHDDGTLGYYSGHASLTVRPTLGDRVEAGAVLADAGDDGWTFSVVAPEEEGRERRLSICFVTASGRVCEPESDQQLVAR